MNYRLQIRNGSRYDGCRDRAIRKRLFRGKIEETLTRSFWARRGEIDGAGATSTAGVHALGRARIFKHENLNWIRRT